MHVYISVLARVWHRWKLVQRKTQAHSGLLLYITHAGYYAAYTPANLLMKLHHIAGTGQSHKSISWMFA